MLSDEESQAFPVQSQQNLITAQHLFHGNLKIHGAEYALQEFPGYFCGFVLFFL